jgi:DNA polymerase gamma 1
MPKWYKDLFATNGADVADCEDTDSTLLLRLSWDGHPLVWSDKYGWTFQVPLAEAFMYNDKPVVQCEMSDEKDLNLRDDRKHMYFKLPHKDGLQARCASPLAKGICSILKAEPFPPNIRTPRKR